MEELGLDLAITLKFDLEENVCVVTDWIYLTQEKDQSQALVNIVMDFRVRYKAEIFFTCYH
jgi:hypothetical protein